MMMRYRLKNLQGFSLVSLPFFAWLLFIVWLFTLSACSREPDSEVIAFVNKINAEKSGGIEKLPTFAKFESYKFSATHLRSPFEAMLPTEAKKPVVAKKRGPAPDMTRRREPLETFPLDSLRMVGTIERKGIYWVLIKDPHGMVYHVRLGNYLGENFGRIVKVTDKYIDIHEWVSDGEGGFRERTVKLHMRE